MSRIHFCVSQERLSQSQQLRFYAGVSTDHLPPQLEFSFLHREAGRTPQKYSDVHGAKSQECRFVCIQKGVRWFGASDREASWISPDTFGREGADPQHRGGVVLPHPALERFATPPETPR